MSPSRGKRSAVSSPQRQSESRSSAQDVSTDASAAARTSGRARRNLITLVVIGLIAVGVSVATAQSVRPRLNGDTITQVFSQGQPCATAQIAILAPPGADPQRLADTLFSALQSVPGMNSATYNVKTSTLEAGFCESQGSEATVRSALAQTGLLAAVDQTQTVPSD